jgi:hypothetical protein
MTAIRQHHQELFYFEGEKPKALTTRFIDDAGALDITFSAATLVAKFSIDGAAQPDVAMTNNANGTGTINWPTGTSPFVVAAGKTESTGSIDVQATQGANVWFPTSFTFPIVKRV